MRDHPTGQCEAPVTPGHPHLAAYFLLGAKKNIARIANAFPCHSLLKGNSDAGIVFLNCQVTFLQGDKPQKPYCPKAPKALLTCLKIICKFHRIEQRRPSIEEAVDVVEAAGVEVVDGEGDVDVRLQGNLQQLSLDLARQG